MLFIFVWYTFKIVFFEIGTWAFEREKKLSKVIQLVGNISREKLKSRIQFKVFWITTQRQGTRMDGPLVCGQEGPAEPLWLRTLCLRWVCRRGKLHIPVRRRRGRQRKRWWPGRCWGLASSPAYQPGPPGRRRPPSFLGRLSALWEREREKGGWREEARD